MTDFLSAAETSSEHTLTYYRLLSQYAELVSKLLLIYTPSSYGATLTFIWSGVCVHLMNISPICTLHSVIGESVRPTGCYWQKVNVCMCFQYCTNSTQFVKVVMPIVRSMFAATHNKPFCMAVRFSITGCWQCIWC